MNNITITEMMRRARKIKENGDKFTLIGIGPMSKICIRAALELGRDNDLPLMLIASRNQVDSDSFGHGYVCSWDQTRFINDTYAIAKEVGFDGLLYFCRDHGGPWQRDEERSAKLDTEKAMELAKKSYMDDMRAGFHLLHIDPTKDPHISGTVPLDLVLDRTIELIEYLESQRVKENLPEMAYEVGTEETNGGLTEESAFENFINELVRRLKEKNLPIPLFVVGQTGTLTRLTENVGHFNYQFARRLSAIAESHGIGIKQHNSDYLRDAILLDHPNLGVTAANVAPEFGVFETRAYLELCNLESIEFKEECSDLKNTLEREAVMCERWRKWMFTDEEKNMPVETVLKDEKLKTLIVDICGHYTFENETVKKELQKMRSNLEKIGIDADKYAVRMVKGSIERYTTLFNMTGLTGKLMNT